jgi:plastocyanin
MRPLVFLLLLAVTTVARAQTAEIAATVVDEQDRPVANAVVVAVPADGRLRPSSRPREDVVDQVDKEFLPEVQAILVGTAVTFPNNDNVRHHVYSFSPARRFELPLYAGVPAQAIVFDKPGVVVLGCNIHDWMVGYIYVSESPYFAKTGNDGKVLVSELPPGRYTVRVWHPQLEATEESTRRSVDVSRVRHADVGWKLKLKPKVRVRRAPVAGHHGDY